MRIFIFVIYFVVMLCITLGLLFVFMVSYVVTKPFDKQRLFLHILSRLWSKLFFALAPRWSVNVEGVENIEVGTPYIVTVNHQAMIDIPLMYVLPFNFKWVAKQEVYKMPIFGWVMYMHGDIGIDRSSSKAGQKLMTEGHKWLSGGTSIIIFPEGTRTKNGDIGRFKDGAFVLAKSSNVAILPCIIDGTREAMNGVKAKLSHTINVKILPPIPKDTVAQMTPKELAAMVHDRTVEVYEKVRK